MRLAYRAHLAWSPQCGAPNFVTLNLFIHIKLSNRFNWDFRDALRRKSLRFFRHILRIRKQK